MAWGLGAVAEWLDEVIEAGVPLSPEQKRAHQACCRVITAHAKWVGARTTVLLRGSGRLPCGKRLLQTIVHAMPKVAAAGGLDHLYRVHSNATGGCMAIAPWLPEKPARRRR